MRVIRFEFTGNIPNPCGTLVEGGMTMQNSKLFPMSLFFLGMCILCGSLYIGIQLESLRQEIRTPHGGLMTMEETASYLSITMDELDDILRDDRIEKGKMTMYETYRFLPYLEINDELRFNKDQLDLYIEYRTLNHN